MAKQRLNATITIGGVLEKSFKNNIGLIRSGFENVGDSIKGVKARQKELTRQRADLVKQGRSVEALDREYEGLERTLEDLVRKQRRWERAMRDSTRVGETFGRMTSNIGRMGRRMAVGLTAAGTGIFALTSSTAAYGDNVAKTAGKLGIGIAALQEYRYAAERSGVSTESFDSSLTAMQKRLGEAAQGTGAAKKALDQIGLSAQDLVEMGPADALAAIADKMQLIENPAERAAIAAALFSRSGIGMVNMLGNGSEALQQLREDALKTGYVLSEKAARDAEKFADAQLDAQLVVKGLKNTIGAELMPVVTRSMKTFSAWAVSNREDIAAFANTAAAKLEAVVPVIGQVAGGMGSVAMTVGSVVSKVAEMVGGWENFGMVIGALFAAKTIGSVVSFGVAVGRLGISLASLTGVAPLVAAGIKMIGRALLMNPIGLAVGAIAGSAYLVYKHWGKIGPWFSEQWAGVKTTFQGIGTFIGGVWRGDMDTAAAGLSGAWDGAKSLLSNTLKGIGRVFRFAWENGIKPVTDWLGVTSHITGAWEAVQTVFGQVVSGVGSILRTGYDGTIGPVIEALAATGGITGAWAEVKTAIGAVIDWLGKKFDWLMGKLQPVLDGLTWLRDKGSGAIDGIQGIGSGISNWWNGSEAEPQKVSGSYLGGTIGRGFRNIGEQGPETIWSSKGGYVAHAGATERLARMATQAEPMMRALGGGLRNAMSQAQGGLAPAMMPAAAPALTAPPAQVTQHIRIEAGHLSPREIAEALRRHSQSAQAGALFDQPHDYGQYGGG